MARETIASMAVRLGIDLTDFQKDMQEFQKTWGKLGKQLQDAGTKIGVAFTAAGGAIAAGLGVAVNKAMDFDSQMSKLGAIAGATGDDLARLRQTALDLGASTSLSASQVADAMTEMAKKGYDTNAVIAAMPGVIAAAEASGEDLAMVADTVSSALNGFGLKASDASKVADILAQAANASAAGVEDMQYAFKYAAPVAASLGISIEQLSAAVEIMTNNGMKGEQAGTTLRAALQRLTDPPKEAAAELQKLGVSVTDASGKFLPFDQIIAQLSASTAKMTDAQKAQALSTIFGTEAMTGMLSIITTGPDKFRALTAELQNSGGASATAAAQMKDNLAGSMQELQGAIETLQISFGSALAPAIRAVAEALAGAVNWFNQLSPEAQKWIAIGAALTAGLLLLAGAVGFLVAGLGALAAAEWAVILPVAGIIAAFVAAGAAVAALAYVIYDNWDSIKSATVSAWDAIKGAIQSAWDAITGIFKAIWNTIGPIVTAGWDMITSYFNASFETWKTIVSAVWEAIKTIFYAAFLIIYDLVTGRWDDIGKVFAAAGEKLKTILSDAWEKIKSIWSSAFTAISNAASEGWQKIKELFSTAWDAIKQFFATVPQQAFEIGKNIIQGMMDGVASMAKALADKAMAVVQAAVNAAKSFLGIHSPSKVFMEIGAYTGEGFAIGLNDSASMVSDAAQNMAAVPLTGVTDMTANVPNVSVAGQGAEPTTLVIEMDSRVIAQKTFERMGGMLRMRGAVT
jgi:TP901 family phage tail tape measure protein